VPLTWGWIPVYVAWAAVYFCTKWCLHPSSRLATIDMDRKLGSCAKFHLDTYNRLTTIEMGRKCRGSAPFWEGGAGSPSNTKSPGPRPTSIPSGILIHSIQLFGYNRYGPKIGGLCPFGGGRFGSPSNTMSPGPRPTCVSSFILIHPTVWPQYTNVTDRTDRQTGQTMV